MGGDGMGEFLPDEAMRSNLNGIGSDAMKPYITPARGRAKAMNEDRR
jgi:hypothetical protein